MRLEARTHTATAIWGSTFDEAIQIVRRVTYELGDSNLHCGSGLGKSFDECVGRCGVQPMSFISPLPVSSKELAARFALAASLALPCGIAPPVQSSWRGWVATRHWAATSWAALRHGPLRHDRHKNNKNMKRLIKTSSNVCQTFDQKHIIIVSESSPDRL